MYFTTSAKHICSIFQLKVLVVNLMFSILKNIKDTIKEEITWIIHISQQTDWCHKPASTPIFKQSVCVWEATFSAFTGGGRPRVCAPLCIISNKNHLHLLEILFHWNRCLTWHCIETCIPSLEWFGPIVTKLCSRQGNPDTADNDDDATADENNPYMSPFQMTH